VMRHRTVARRRPVAGKVFSMIAVGVLVVATPVLAEEGAGPGASQPAVTPDENLFYARVASFLGLDPKVVQAAMPELQREGVNERDSVLLLLFGYKRTLRLLREEKITKEEVEKSFHDSILAFLETRRARPTGWKGYISTELALELHDVAKQAANTVREARKPADVDRPERAVSAARLREVPEEFAQPIQTRLRLRPEVLKKAWGQLESVQQRDPRGAIKLLILAREKTDRLLEFGVIAKEEKDKMFLDNLADFISQVESNPAIWWGGLASQVGLHSRDLNDEALIIFNAAAEVQSRKGIMRAERPAVPRELIEW
jgi:hypothetical protein